MKENGILKRLLTMASVCVLALALFFGSAFVYYRFQSESIRTVLRDWDDAYRGLYLCGQAERTEEKLQALRDAVCGYYTEPLASEYAQTLYDAASELSTGVRSVERYDEIETRLDVDYRYGGVRAVYENVVDYEGYGGYLFDEEDEAISWSGKCVRTIQMEKIDGQWKIASLKIEWQK